MGERANGVNQEPPRKVAREIEGEISHIREQLDVSLAELDRRRHELTDVKLQVRRHPALVVVAGVVVLGLVGGVAYSIYAARQRNRPVSKARRLRRAVARMVDQPEQVARGTDPTVPEKILGAVGATVATMVARKLIEEAFNRAGRRDASPRPV
jgi:hypothetical protein